MKEVAVIGAGSWGTALSMVLADNEYNVHIWLRSQEQRDQMNDEHRNEKYLPEVELPHSIVADLSLERVVLGKDVVLIVMPSHLVRETARQIKPFLHKEALIIHATKGFEIESLKRMSEVIHEETGFPNEQIVVLSGPSHAEEVSRKAPTTVVVACTNNDNAEIVQDMFMNQYFRVYTNPDVVGVEIGGALKNIIALGTGMTDGLGFGDNAKAALMTRGLAEIARVGITMGANPLTFAGLAGVGDLIATCTSKHSRNWRAGYQLGQGRSLEEVLSQMGMVVEGVRTTKAAHRLAEHFDVKMPIAEQLYAVLFNGKVPRTAVEDLMGRVKTHEVEDVMHGLNRKNDS